MWGRGTILLPLSPGPWMLLRDGGESGGHLMVVNPNLLLIQEILRIWNAVFPVKLVGLINQILNSQVHAVE